MAKVDKSKLTKSTRRKTGRPNIDQYFLKMALVVSERATCKRHSIGSVLVKDKMVISTGYNGAARGAKDCLELGCLRDEMGIKSGEKAEICRAIHAEQNAIIQASSKGISIDGSTMYCTHTPCNICAKIMANAGVKEVVAFAKYADDAFKKLFKELGIKVRFVKMPEPLIDF
jgi:dCMP deaminase